MAPETDTVGAVFTTTEMVAVPVQPAPEVPVTVYVDVVAGVTDIEVPDPPVLQE
ncbi:hypothetical protein SDC9_144394 [bioreactor metagenome]|uniref:Uncharacterized protein n=1 Tax=bioreactor metagenome TaxID=1076179 RepID=A0A645E6N6_9ZZZZ